MIVIILSVSWYRTVWLHLISLMPSSVGLQSFNTGCYFVDYGGSSEGGESMETLLCAVPTGEQFVSPEAVVPYSLTWWLKDTLLRS